MTTEQVLSLNLQSFSMETLQPAFSLWTILFLMAAGQGLFFSFLIFMNKKNRQTANWLLGLFILMFALTLIDYVGFWTHYNIHFPNFANSWQIFVFTFGPLLYLYFKMVNTTQKLTWRDGLHFLPLILMFFLVRVPYLSLSSTSKITFLMGKFDEEFIANMTLTREIWKNFNLIILGHLTIYTLLCWRFITQKKQEHPDLSIQQKRWYHTLLGLFVGFVFSFYFYYFLIETPWFSLFYDYSISFAMTVFIYTVGYLGHYQPEIFAGQKLQPIFRPVKYQSSSLTKKAADSLLQHLLHLMDKEEVYKNNELRLASLADQLNTSPHHLSQVINEKLGKSFSEFINTYRVKAAQKMLLDPKNKQTYIINIAYAAGFNNKTSFNKAFKADTGMSPSVFRKKAKEKEKAEGV